MPSCFFNADLYLFWAILAFFVLFLLELIHLFELFEAHIGMLKYRLGQIIDEIFHDAFFLNAVRAHDD